MIIQRCRRARINPILLGLCVAAFLESGSVSGQDKASPLLSANDIVDRIGSEPETDAILRAVLTMEFGRDRRSTPEFLLGSQLHPEWLPSLEGIKFALLSDTETTPHLASCGTYSFVESVERTGDEVIVELRRKCGCSGKRYRVVLEGNEWRPRVGGIGSGCAGYPPDCPCLGR